MPTLKELEKWLSTGQASSRLGVSRQGALWLANNGHLRGVKTACGWLFDPSSIEDYRVKRAEAPGLRHDPRDEFAG